MSFLAQCRRLIFKIKWAACILGALVNTGVLEGSMFGFFRHIHCGLSVKETTG